MKQYYCFLEKFNNYFNRKIIKYSSLEDYQNNSKDFFIPEDSNGNMLPFDFNPNDNVMTEIIANDLEFTPDYFLLLDAEQNIISRWFILEEKRNRQGQWLYTLRRDVISDNLDTLYTAPIFVQKAWLKEDDPFIFNSEGMNFNQVKIGERLLKDASKSAWLVAYIARNEHDTISVQQNSAFGEYLTIPQISDATGISQDTLTAMINVDGQKTQFQNVISSGKLQVIYRGLWEPYLSYDAYYTKEVMYLLFDENNINILSRQGTPTGITNTTLNQILNLNPSYVINGVQGEPYLKTCVENIKNYLNDHQSGFKSNLSSILGQEVITLEQIQKLNEILSQKIVQYSGKYYNVAVSQANNISNAYKDFIPSGYTTISNAVSSCAVGEWTSTTSGTMRLNYKVQGYCLMFEAISNLQCSLVISASRNTLNEREYDMLCMPYNDIEIATSATTTQSTTSSIYGSDYQYSSGGYDYYRKTFTPALNVGEVLQNIEIPNAYNVIFNDSSYTVIYRSPIPMLDDAHVDLATTLTILLPNERSNGDICRRIASEIGRQMGTSCYDVQLLPYCPLTDKVYQNGIDISGMTEDEDYTFIKDTLNAVVGICFYCKYDSFQVFINETIVSTENSLKIENECHAYRLVSPNYQGIFDFSVAKNGGKVPSFTAFCTYKPFTPYIKVAPFFMNLYGAEYGDNRGLICGGDFSISRVNSEWVQYQLNNKNYQNIFNRDIQNLDFQQSQEMRTQLFTSILGAVGDTGKGAAAGFAASGSPYGAIAGGIIGGGTSTIGGIIDTTMLAERQRETRSYAIDKYNFNLGNIKALPYTLTKVSAFDINSKIFPFVEFYSCTDTEKAALENKLRYESMTVMRIGTINEFTYDDPKYFKGELIRNDEIADDPHTLNAIYEELLKGVFI